MVVLIPASSVTYTLSARENDIGGMGRAKNHSRATAAGPRSLGTSYGLSTRIYQAA
jgi:hypothetical protein